jgi:predicted hydrocarbon binding protein
MDRKEFLKSACTLGACGCMMSVVGGHELLAADEKPADQKPPEDRRLAFARFQVANMVAFMAADPKPEACAAILEKTGRECAKLGQLGAKLKGDLEGYFAAVNRLWGTECSQNKETGLITVAVAEGDCGCPMVDPKRTPAFFCHCSAGYQQESFEAILGRPVTVALKESKLGGSKRCVFEVRPV